MTAQSKNQFQMAPTFPLEDAEIKRRIINAKLLHPVTLGVAFGCIGLTVLLKGSIVGLVFLGGLGFAGLVAWWKNHGAKLEAKVIQAMILESNQAQDRKLAGIVARYRRRRLYHYASALGKFIYLKKQIEQQLHQDGKLTSEKEQIDSLVDKICAAACRLFAKLTELDRAIAASLTSGTPEQMKALEKDRTEVLERIMHAYKTVHETFQHVTDALVPPPLPDNGAGSGTTATNVDDVIRQLEEENRINRAVRERLKIQAATPEDPDFGAFEEPPGSPQLEAE
ncbi:MAG: hypothetical protein AAF591_14165 [Verrucomicrobiota bacterium]